MEDWRAPVTRWALICWEPQNAAQIPAIRLVAESRVAAWEAHDWIALGRDSDIAYADIEDVRREDEKGNR